MYCPSCGQQQISTETKFCSRCGLPLGIVSEVISYGGYLPQLAELSNKKPSIFTRRNGLAFSLIWGLFFLFILTPLVAIMKLGELPAATGILGIFGGLILMISSLIFLKKEPTALPPAFARYGQPPAELPVHQSFTALPPQQSVPASVYAPPQTGSWRDTNELQPTSVTESTTRLLEKDEIRDN